MSLWVPISEPRLQLLLLVLTFPNMPYQLWESLLVSYSYQIEKIVQIGSAFLGFGLLFFGLDLMGEQLKTVSQLPFSKSLCKLFRPIVF